MQRPWRGAGRPAGPAPRAGVPVGWSRSAGPGRSRPAAVSTRSPALWPHPPRALRTPVVRTPGRPANVPTGRVSRTGRHRPYNRYVCALCPPPHSGVWYSPIVPYTQGSITSIFWPCAKFLGQTFWTDFKCYHADTRPIGPGISNRTHHSVKYDLKYALTFNKDMLLIIYHVHTAMMFVLSGPHCGLLHYECMISCMYDLEAYRLTQSWNYGNIGDVIHGFCFNQRHACKPCFF